MLLYWPFYTHDFFWFFFPWLFLIFFCYYIDPFILNAWLCFWIFGEDQRADAQNWCVCKRRSTRRRRSSPSCCGVPWLFLIFFWQEKINAPTTQQLIMLRCSLTFFWFFFGRRRSTRRRRSSSSCCGVPVVSLIALFPRFINYTHTHTHTPHTNTQIIGDRRSNATKLTDLIGSCVPKVFLMCSYVYSWRWGSPTPPSWLIS